MGNTMGGGHDMANEARKVIYVDEDGWVHLQRESRRQRGAKFDEKDEAWLRKRYADQYGAGFVALCDGWLGGGNGSPDASTWTSWSVGDMCLMLLDADYPYGIGHVGNDFILWHWPASMDHDA